MCTKSSVEIVYRLFSLRKIDAGIEGLKIGLVKEGFEFQAMDVDVAEIVKGAANKLNGAGATVEDTSIPLHNDGMFSLKIKIIIVNETIKRNFRSSLCIIKSFCAAYKIV